MGIDSSSFQISCGCLKDQCCFSQAKSSYMTHAQKKTFSRALNNAYDIPLSQFPSPCVKGDLIFVVQIDEDVYLAGLEDGKNHFHGRIVPCKCDKLLTHINMCTKLDLA